MPKPWLMFSKLLGLYLRETMNRHTAVFVALMLLVTIFLVANIQGSQDQINIYDPVELSVVDNDDSYLSHSLISQFEAVEFVGTVHVDSMDMASRRLDRDEVLLILVIPDQFYEQTVNGLMRDALTVHLNDRMPAESTVFVRLLNNTKTSIEAMQASLFAGQDLIRPLYDNEADYLAKREFAMIDMSFRLLGRRTVVDVDTSGKLNTVSFIISSLTSLLAMLTALQALLQVSQERRLGMHQRLLVGNVPWYQPILGKQLVGLLWLVTGFAPLLALLASFYPELPIVRLALPLMLLFWITAMLCQAVGYLAKPAETTLLGAWLGMLALMLLGGAIYPYQLLPAFLQRIAVISPVRWSYLSLYGSLEQDPFNWLAITILAGMALLSSLAVGLISRRVRAVV